MTENVRAFLDEDAKRILESHLAVGARKPVSYLPLKTVENVIGIPIQECASLIEKSGNKIAIFDAQNCCIDSGAIYAYSRVDLERILRNNQAVLAEHGWPTTPADFIERIAAAWLDDENPIMPIIRKAFGEE